MMNKWFLIGVFLVSSFCFLNAQDSIVVEQEKKRIYRSIVADSLLIVKNDSALHPFFEKLQALENGDINRLNIVHIGDSHIQADWLTGTMRNEFQSQFGNAGRGLVFPYKVAKTNSPPDVYSFSNTEWDRYRNIHQQTDYEVGISGHVIGTKDSAAILKIALNPKTDLDYKFNKLTFLHPLGTDYYEFFISSSENRDILEQTSVKYDDVKYKVQSGDYLGKIAVKFNTTISNIKQLNGIRNDNIYAGQTLVVKKQSTVQVAELPEDAFEDYLLVCCTDVSCTVVELDTLLEYVFMRNAKSLPNQKLMQWDGIVLENTLESGILYHAIGVNGAMHSHYNKWERFFEQLPDLNPDLIIVSLGTNEGLNQRINQATFESDLDTFYAKIKKYNANVPILLTTPPDNRKQPLGAEQLTAYLLDFAENNEKSLFDYYSILGGKGSFQNLQNKRLAQPDRVHFTAQGYIMQGELLFDAIMKSYKTFKLNHNVE